MIKLIAETAWHHQGDFVFMKDLVTKICEKSTTDIVKFHITLDLDEYMDKDHEAYELLKSWVLSEQNWEELIGIVRNNNKELMLLLNDTKAINFAKKFNPEMIELHSVCLNVPRLKESILKKIHSKTKIVIGVGGCTIEEVQEAVEFFRNRETILMFGFQNYPTEYEDVNLYKVRKLQSLFRDKIFGYADHTAWDESSNELITLLVSANGMEYIEKHVTTFYGEERCDYSAAVSISQLNSLHKSLKLLGKINGDGSLELNQAEKKYSVYGPMKMAPLVVRTLSKGHELTINDFSFRRTSQITDMSQLDVLKNIGTKLVKSIEASQVITWKHISSK